MFCVEKNDHNENVGKWIYSKTLQDSLSKSSLITKSGISKCSLNVDVQVNDFGTEKSSKIRELSFWPKKQATVGLELTSETQRVPKVGIKVSNSYETVMKHAMSKKAGDDGFALSTHTMYTFKLKTKDGFKLGDINKGFFWKNDVDNYPTDWRISLVRQHNFPWAYFKSLPTCPLR